MSKGLTSGIIVLTLLLTIGTVIGASPIFEDDFTSYPLNTELVWLEHPWAAWEGAPAIVADKAPNPGGQSVLLAPRSTEPLVPDHHEGGYLLRSFDPEKEQLTLTFAVWLQTGKRALAVDMGQSPIIGVGGGAVSLYFHDGTIRGYAGGWYDSNYTYPVQTWFQVKLDIDVPGQAYRINVKTEADKDWQPIMTVPFRRPHQAIEYVLFTNYEVSTPRTSAAYITDITLYSHSIDEEEDEH